MIRNDWLRTIGNVRNVVRAARRTGNPTARSRSPSMMPGDRPRESRGVHDDDGRRNTVGDRLSFSARICALATVAHRKNVGTLGQGNRGRRCIRRVGLPGRRSRAREGARKTSEAVDAQDDKSILGELRRSLRKRPRSGPEKLRFAQGGSATSIAALQEDRQVPVGSSRPCPPSPCRRGWQRLHLGVDRYA